MKSYERVDHRDGYDWTGKIIFMAQSGGYVMVKRPRKHPFVLTLKEWSKVSKTPLPEPPEVG